MMIDNLLATRNLTDDKYNALQRKDKVEGRSISI